MLPILLVGALFFELQLFQLFQLFQLLQLPLAEQDSRIYGGVNGVTFNPRLLTSATG